MTYAKEFRDFVLTVTIPAGFDDISWHNDSNPRWRREDGDHDIEIWVDYADEALRENPAGKQFTLYQLPPKWDDHMEGEWATLCSTDDYDELLRVLAAYDAGRSACQ